MKSEQNMADIPVSIIVVFRNEENYIEDCIKSILLQNHKNFELILYDDNSTDKSLQIICKFKDKRIKYYKNINHMGISKTRNNALKKVKNSLVFFTDADCIADRFWLSAGIESLFSDCVGVEGLTDYISEQTTISDKIVENKKGKEYMTCNIGYKTDVLRKVNGFNTKFGNMMEDRELAFRVMKCGQILFNPKMKVIHQKKIWNYSNMINRFKEQGKTKVLMHKLHKDTKYIHYRIAFPTHLLTLFFPPLLLVKALRDKVRSKLDLKILFITYLAYFVERIQIWKTSMKEKDIIL